MAAISGGSTNSALRKRSWGYGIVHGKLFLTAVAVTGLSIYCIATSGINFASLIFGLITGSWTIIYSMCLSCAPKGANFSVIVVLDLFSLGLWVAASVLFFHYSKSDPKRITRTSMYGYGSYWVSEEAEPDPRMVASGVLSILEIILLFIALAYHHTAFGPAKEAQQKKAISTPPNPTTTTTTTTNNNTLSTQPTTPATGPTPAFAADKFVKYTGTITTPQTVFVPIGTSPGGRILPMFVKIGSPSYTPSSSDRSLPQGNRRRTAINIDGVVVNDGQYVRFTGTTQTPVDIYLPLPNNPQQQDSAAAPTGSGNSDDARELGPMIVQFGSASYTSGGVISEGQQSTSSQNKARRSLSIDVDLELGPEVEIPVDGLVAAGAGGVMQGQETAVGGTAAAMGETAAVSGTPAVGQGEDEDMGFMDDFFG
ncbi:hypothetical protein VTJ04DRAFT_10551 [Mycothermus thermophilus]|uniref:uncharacterized protein n=1 Tax=Humicola insolens TaxID=85995 RepID=UPI003742695D